MSQSSSMSATKSDNSRELKKLRKTLSIINDAMRRYIQNEHSKDIFDFVIEETCKITGSQYGLLGYIEHTNEGSPYIRGVSLWGESVDSIERATFDQVRLHNIKEPFTTLINGPENTIRINKFKKPKDMKLPNGHPPINRILASHAVYETQSLGVIALINKKTNYRSYDMEAIDSIANCVGMLMKGYQNKSYMDSAAESKLNVMKYMDHELKSPLYNIVSTIGVLDKDVRPSKEIRPFINIIKESCKTLLTLHNNMDEVVRLESNDVVLNKEPYSIKDVIKGIKQTVEKRIKDKKIKFTQKIDADVPLQVLGDQMRLQQILNNLISNAVKYTDEKGSISISVKSLGICKSLSISNEDDIYEIRFRIKDNGPGIDKNKYKTIFDSMQKSEDISYGNIGLKLSISYKLCQLMGGRMWVRSEEGVGTTFYFTIKVRNHTDISNLLTTYGNHIKNISVMLIEPSGSVRNHLSSILLRWQMKLTVVSSIDDAYSNLLANSYKLAIVSSQFIDKIDKIKEYMNEINIEFPLIVISKDHKNIIGARIINNLDESILLTNIIKCIEDTKIQNNNNSILREKKPLSILIAEDDETNMKFITRVLDVMGYKNYQTARTGVDALEIFKTDMSFDVVLLDEIMPGMKGHSVAAAICKICTEKAIDPPEIALVSAIVKNHELPKYKKYGITEIIAKPIIDIEASIRPFLERSRDKRNKEIKKRRHTTV